MTLVGEAFVRIRPDTDSFRRELRGNVSRDVRGLETSLSSSNRELSRFGRGTLVGTGALGGLGRAAAFASSTFIGGAGLTFAIRSTIAAAEESQVAETQLANALERQGISFAQNRQAIDARTQALSQMSGFDDELISRTFTNFVRRTGDVTTALRYNAIAVDVARGRNISLEAASALVTRASLGLAGSLRRVGIAARDGATATELLNLLQRKYAGSAVAYGNTAAGAQARFAVALENTQEIIGTALLPSLTQLLNKATDWLNNSKHQQEIQRTTNAIVEKGGIAFHVLGVAIDGARIAWEKYDKAVDKFPGDDNNGFFATLFKGSLFDQLDSFGKTTEKLARQLHLIGAGADDAAVSIGRLARGYDAIEQARQRARLAGAGGTGFEDFPALSIGRPLTAKEQLDLSLAGSPDNIGLLQQRRAQQQKRLDFAKKQIDDLRGNTSKFAAAAIDATSEIQRINAQIEGIRAAAAAQAEQAAQDAADARQRALDAILGRAELQVARAEQTASAEDDLKALNNLARVLRSQIAVTTDNLGLQNQLIDVQNKIATARQAALEGLVQVPEALRLQVEIAQASAKNAADTLPILRREREIQREHIRTLREQHAGQLLVLQATANLAQIDQQIAQVRDQLNAANKERVERLTQVPERLQLQLQLAEARVKNEEDLIPFLAREANALTKQIRTLRNQNANKNLILQAEVERANINKRIRDIRNQDNGGAFTLTQFFAEAAREERLYGSNIGTSAQPLSGQDARAGVAKSALAGATIVQHFHGDRPDPAQALQQASQAARALR